MMETESENQNNELLWIDSNRKIISFKECEQFELLQFGSKEEKMNYVIEQGLLGYRIQ